jgi:hypothetical protein
MIESVYWKEDLLSTARALKPLKKPPRWSEKSMVNFEKRLMISFFMIRKLLETGKLSKKSHSHQAYIFSYEPSGKEITLLNHRLIDEIYDFEKESRLSKNILFIANQFIHCNIIFAIQGKDRNWEDVYVVSDRDRKKTIYRVPVCEIKKILELVGTDYAHNIKWFWDPKIDDYRIEVP